MDQPHQQAARPSTDPAEASTTTCTGLPGRGEHGATGGPFPWIQGIGPKRARLDASTLDRN
jgi:hypothetical protein